MNEPKRWLDDGAPEVIGRMLRAAGDERPSAAALERAVAGLAVGAGLTAATSSVAGAAVKGSSLASGVFLKWTLLGTLATLGVGGLAVGASRMVGERAASPSDSRASTPAPDQPKQALELPPTAPPAVSEPAATTPTPQAARPASGSEPGRDSERAQGNAATSEVVPLDAEALTQETRLVDRARSELAAGHAAATLAALDEYHAGFPRPRYAPEALYLRMEALLALGKTQAARQVASRLASSHPSSPHAARAEAVLSTTIP